MFAHPGASETALFHPSVLLVLVIHHSFCDDALLEARPAPNGGGRFPTSPW